MNIPTGKYPEAFYRVSLKAIIRNDKGEVLLVKEKGGNWSLPGGGMDHGETVEQALAREMFEEVLVTASFQANPVGIEPRFVKTKDAWLLWVVYELEIPEPFSFGLGEDADEVAFMNPAQFKNSEVVPEKLVYKWCVDRSTPVDTY